MNNYAKVEAARMRYMRSTGKPSNDIDVIAFLCDEIDGMREKVKECDKARFTAAFLEKELGRCRETIASKGKRVKELTAQLDAVTQTEPATEQAADGGVMTIKNATCYQDIVSILLANGYFVCCHIDDENGGETITIEYWRG